VLVSDGSRADRFTCDERVAGQLHACPRRAHAVLRTWVSASGRECPTGRHSERPMPPFAEPLNQHPFSSLPACTRPRTEKRPEASGRPKWPPQGCTAVRAIAYTCVSGPGQSEQTHRRDAAVLEWWFANRRLTRRVHSN